MLFSGARRLSGPEERSDVLASGTCELSLDDKFRFAVPRSFLAAFPERTRNEIGVVLAPHYTGCIAIWDYGLWEHQMEGRRAASSTPEGYKAYQSFSAMSHVVQLDAHRRLLIPPTLRSLGGLAAGCAISLLGVGDHVEIWSAERWGSQLQEALGVLLATPGPVGPTLAAVGAPLPDGHLSEQVEHGP